jgi:hypothetical protein
MRRSLNRARSLAGSLKPSIRWPLVLGTFLLATSTAAVVATQNTPVDITNATLSRTVINEGDTVTLSATFADPDATDGHAVFINWGKDGYLRKWRLPIGQRAFQINHTFRDDKNSYGQLNDEVSFTIVDHQLPWDSNDNTTGKTYDYARLPIQVKNVPPTFPAAIASSTERISATLMKLTLDGMLADPGADTHEVRASMVVGPKTSPRAGTLCTVADRRFHCELTFKAPAQAYDQPILLWAKDDDGGEGTRTITVTIDPDGGPSM